MGAVLPLDARLGRYAAVAIAGYQRWISPRKGFACAHRVLHGGESCSQHVRRVVAEEGLLAGLRALRPRLRACREAAREYRAYRGRLAFGGAVGFDDALDGDLPPPSKSRPGGASVPWTCDPGGAQILDCLPGCGDSPGADCSFDVPDCGGCDVGGCG